MDDLVVVILTLLIAGAGAIGQMKKKKQVPVEPGEYKTPEDIWELFKGEVYPQKPYKEPVVTKFEKENSEPAVNEQGYKFEAKNEGGLLVKKEMKVQPTVTKNAIKSKPKFPLRKAVIYSEILNRKYI
jgi:hypothetical protein